MGDKIVRALCLSGGGSKGAYQVGVLKHLLGDLKIKYDIICGVSVGAINALQLAAYPHGQEKECSDGLLDMWNTLKQEDIYVSWCPFGRLHFLWKSSLYNSAPLKEYLEKHIQVEGIRNSGKKLRIGAVNLNTARYEVFDENAEDLVKATLASSSNPVSFLPIEIDGNYWTDGGVRNTIPFLDAIDAGATHVDVISNDIANLQYEEDVLKLNLPLRVLSIMSEEISNNDLVYSQDNRNVIIIRPEFNIIKDPLKFSQETIQPTIEQGYNDAVAMYPK